MATGIKKNLPAIKGTVGFIYDGYTLHGGREDLGASWPRPTDGQTDRQKIFPSTSSQSEVSFSEQADKADRQTDPGRSSPSYLDYGIGSLEASIGRRQRPGQADSSSEMPTKHWRKLGRRRRRFLRYPLSCCLLEEAPTSGESQSVCLSVCPLAS